MRSDEYRCRAMPRAIWSGAISFGLVNIPVKLYSAVQRKTVRFHQLDQEDKQRIQQRRVNPRTGEEVPYENLVKGYEIGPDRYVVITPEELESIQPEKTRMVDIVSFVDLDQIDPIFYDHPYYLVPDTGADKAYRLLLDAMGESGKVAIGRVVLRTKEYLVAIRPREDEREGARDGAAADRLAGRGFRARSVPGRVPRAGARADRPQGAGRGDRD